MLDHYLIGLRRACIREVGNHLLDPNHFQLNEQTALKKRLLVTRENLLRLVTSNRSKVSAPFGGTLGTPSSMILCDSKALEAFGCPAFLLAEIVLEAGSPERTDWPSQGMLFSRWIESNENEALLKELKSTLEGFVGDLDSMLTLDYEETGAYTTDARDNFTTFQAQISELLEATIGSMRLAVGKAETRGKTAKTENRLLASVDIYILKCLRAKRYEVAAHLDESGCSIRPDQIDNAYRPLKVLLHDPKKFLERGLKQ